MKKLILCVLFIVMCISTTSFGYTTVRLGPEYFPETSRGRPIALGSIYVGQPDLDPEIVGNQKTLSVQQEDGTIVAVTQPIYTNAGGVPVYSGSPVTLLVEGTYSLKVLDSSDAQVYYVPSTTYDGIAQDNCYPSYAAVDQGVTGDNNTLKYCIDTIGADQATIVLRHNSGSATTTYTLTTSETIPSNITLKVERGAILDGAGTLTFATGAKFEPPGTAKCFDSDFVVIFGYGSLDEVWPDWWETNATPGTTDMTTALNSAYASAAVSEFVGAHATMRLLPATYKFTSQLVWDKQLNVIGVHSNQSILSKIGDFIGIKIQTPYKYSDFGVIGEYNPSSLLPDNVAYPASAGAYHGIVIRNGSRIDFSNIKSSHHDGYGIYVDGNSDATAYGSLIGNYNKIETKFNGSDGFRMEDNYGFGGAGTGACWANTITDVDTLGNGGWGFNLESASTNVCLNIVSQSNGTPLGTIGGIRINKGLANYVIGYIENTLGTLGVEFTANTTRNQIIITNDDVLGYIDNGASNRIGGPGTVVETFQAIGRTKPGTNLVGTELIIYGGAAGAGATGKTGGNLKLAGGSADGTTGDANGGQVFLQGGSPVNSGDRGAVVLQQYGVGGGAALGHVLIGSNTLSSQGAAIDIVSTTGAVIIPRMTTAQRDAISQPLDGMMVFDTDRKQYMAYHATLPTYWYPIPQTINTAPASAGATGSAGDIRFDDSYLYICTGANAWKRVSIAAW